MPSPIRATLVGLLLLAALELSARVLHWLQPLLHGAATGMAIWFFEALRWYAALVCFAVPVTLAERLAPGSAGSRHYGRALLLWAFYMPFSLLALPVAHWILGLLALRPLFELRLDDWALSGTARVAANAGLLLLGVVLFDLFLYWFHRMEHRVPLFWRMHRAHHAIRGLNAVACYHHPLEDILRIPFFLVPMALVFRIDAPQMVFLSAFLSAWAYISHMDSALHFGPLVRQVFVDNRYHRLHHSMAREHFDCNFASYFAPWDRLFGTQCMPLADTSAVRVGLADVAEPTSLRELWQIPFQPLPAAPSAPLAWPLVERRSSVRRAHAGAQALDL